MDRTSGAVLGAFAADSLALGAHWEYDQQRIKSTLGEVRELLPPTLNNYHPGKKAGDQSHYGDQALLLLRCVKGSGCFALEDFAARWRIMMESYTGYMDHASKDTLANMRKGADSTNCGALSYEFAGPARMVPLLCLHNPQSQAGLEALARDAKAQTLLTHNSPILGDIAVFFAQALHHLYQGSGIQDALTQSAGHTYELLAAKDWLELALGKLGEAPSPVITALGQSCSAQGAMPSVLYLALKYEDDPVQGLVKNVMAGGDSCGRGLMLGALFGARHGIEWIPTSWLNKLAVAGELAQSCREQRVE